MKYVDYVLSMKIINKIQAWTSFTMFLNDTVMDFVKNVSSYK